MADRVSVARLSLVLLVLAACQAPEDTQPGANIVIALDSSVALDVAPSVDADHEHTAHLDSQGEPQDSGAPLDSNSVGDASSPDLGTEGIDSSTQPDASQNDGHQCGPYDLSRLDKFRF